MRVRKLNDESLEYAIALARWGGLIWLLTGWLLSGASIWVDSWRVGALGFMVAVVGFVACWFGWFRYGNPEWSSGKKTAEAKTCAASYTIALEDGTDFKVCCAKPLGHREREHDPLNPFLPVPDGGRWTSAIAG